MDWTFEQAGRAGAGIMCTPPQGQELTNNTVRELSQEHKVVHEFTTECHFQARRDYETMARSWWGFNGSGVGRGVRGSEVLVPFRVW